MLLSHLLVVTGSLWHHLVCRHITPTAISIFTWLSLLSVSVTLLSSEDTCHQTRGNPNPVNFPLPSQVITMSLGNKHFSQAFMRVIVQIIAQEDGKGTTLAFLFSVFDFLQCSRTSALLWFSSGIAKTRENFSKKFVSQLKHP